MNILGPAIYISAHLEDLSYSVFQVGCPEEIKKWELSLFVQVTTAVFISSRFHSAVVTCTNKDNSGHSLLDKQPEIHCKGRNRQVVTTPMLLNREKLVLYK